jgi:hypothetical protein
MRKKYCFAHFSTLLNIKKLKSKKVATGDFSSTTMFITFLTSKRQTPRKIHKSASMNKKKILISFVYIFSINKVHNARLAVSQMIRFLLIPAEKSRKGVVEGRKKSVQI